MKQSPFDVGHSFTCTHLALKVIHYYYYFFAYKQAIALTVQTQSGIAVFGIINILVWIAGIYSNPNMFYMQVNNSLRSANGCPGHNWD